MNLFDNIDSPKDQSPIEDIEQTEMTQPYAFALTIAQRKKIKEAMKIHYGSNVKNSNYSVFFLELINMYINENGNS